MGRVKADWVAIEPLYRAGVKSVNELARENGLTEGAIRKHAKKHEWKRDLTEKVRARTREMLVQDLAGTKDGTKDDGTNVQRAPLSERVTVEQGALTQIGVLREQRKTIGNGHKLTLRLLDELDTATTHVGELEKLITTSTDDAKKRNAMLKAASLPGRAAVMRDLATAARTWVNLERQAFGIIEDSKTLAAPVVEKSADELYRDIVARFIELGIPVPELPPPDDDGVTNRRKDGTVRLRRGVTLC